MSFRNLISSFLLVLAATPLSLPAVSLQIPWDAAINLDARTIQIRMNGEDGVQYFVRSKVDLTEGAWMLVETPSSVTGTGQSADFEVTLPEDMTTGGFFMAESVYEHRARLFIENYQTQLEAGGPSVLRLGGVEVQNAITIEEDRVNNRMVITGNGVPNYPPKIMGINVANGFNAANFQSLKLSVNNQGAGGANNPNAVEVALETFLIPLDPVISETATDTALGTVGVAVNGMPLYNPFEDQSETSAAGQILAGCCGHPQMAGVYHYHKYPTCLRLLQGDVWQSEKEKCDQIDAILTSKGHSPLIGYALDGFPVYGPVGWVDTTQQSKLLQSSYTGPNDGAGNPQYLASSGDLDECNGLVSPTPEYPEGIYHYVMSLEANPDGSVVREISPYFGYDVRSTLSKHGLAPSAWDDDAIYLEALQVGFTVNSISIPGTDSFGTFVDFIESLRTLLISEGLSAVAEEFETMKVSYPFTIRKYRGTPFYGDGGGGGVGAAGVTAISPTSGVLGLSYSVTITLQAPAGAPGLPPLGAPITTASVGGIALQSPSRTSQNSVAGTLVLPLPTLAGTKDVSITFAGPRGQPGPSFYGVGLFSVAPQ